MTHPKAKSPRTRSIFMRVTCTGATLAIAGLLAGFAITPAEASPSFKCRGNLNAAEWTICGNAGLGQLDRRMASEYYFQRSRLGSRARNQLRNDQRAWLYRRNSCGSSVGCLRSEYLNRIEQLVEWGL